jgi:lipopolysaccharide biosynthesis regulator YciM
MADPRGKLPSDIGAADWDALLSDIERKVDETAAPAKPPVVPPPRAAAPTPAEPVDPPPSVSPRSVRSPSSTPLYRPSQEGPASARPSGPQNPPSSRPAPPKAPPVPQLYDDDEEERTMVGTISRDLIEEATRGAGGLGQLLGREPPPRRPAEPEGVDVQFDESGHHRAAAPVDDDLSVVTSAPIFSPPARPSRRRDEAELSTPAPPEELASNELPDPFADLRATPPKSAVAQPDSDLQMADPFAPPKKNVPPARPTPRNPAPEDDEPTRVGQIMLSEEQVASLKSASEAKAASARPSAPPPMPRTPPVSAPPKPVPPPEAPRDSSPGRLSETPKPPAPRPPVLPKPAAPKSVAPPRNDLPTLDGEGLTAGPPSGSEPEAPASGRLSLSSSLDLEEPAARPAPAPAARPSVPARTASPRPAATPAAPATTAASKPAPAPGARPATTSVRKASPSKAPPPPAEAEAPAGPPSIRPEAVEAPVDPAFAPTAPAASIPDERDALAHLAEVERLDEWSERAAWLEAEARLVEDPTERARGLLVVSELLAMSGDEERAQTVAEEARELAPSLPLAHRQARSRAARERNFQGFNEQLEAEAKSAPTAAGRAHSVLLSSEILRLIDRDEEAASRKLEQVLRVLPSDPRAHVLKVAAELGASNKAPRYRWPEDAALARLVEATGVLSAIRGAPAKGSLPVTPVDALTRARNALEASDQVAAAEALGSLEGTDGIGEPALWLAASLASGKASHREQAGLWLGKLAGGEDDSTVQKLAAAWAFESGDAERVSSVVGASEVFSSADKATLGVLVGQGREQLEPLIARLADDSKMAPLAAAISAALGFAGGEAGSPAARASASLGRVLARGGEGLEAAVARLATSDRESAVARVLQLEIDAAAGRLDAVGTALATWPRGEDSSATADRDRSLLAALVLELAGARDRAASEAESAHSADPVHEAAARILGALRPEESSALIDKLASEIEDPSRRALLLLEAAVRTGLDADAAPALLRLAYETAPELPFATALGLGAARHANDKETQLSWLRSRREASDDPTEKALDLVREASLVAADDRGLAASLLAEAWKAKPADVALRDWLDRASPEPLADQLAVRAARAENASPLQAVLALSVAYELERSQGHEAASKLAALAAQAGGGALASLVRDRNDAFGPGASRLSEELMAQAKDPADPVAERETYEQLAALDGVGRGDSSAALLWHRSILERDPSYLPSLARLEQSLLGEGREEELEPVLAEIAKVVTGGEIAAHARVAARLRQRQSTWESTRELAQLASRSTPPGTWALRQLEAHALVARDDGDLLRAVTELARRTDRPLERATLLLRSAEATSHKGDQAAAIEHLGAVIAAYPAHLIAHLSLADLLEKSGELRRAAETLEAAAATSQVAQLQVELWHRAAVLWLDHVTPAARAQTNLTSDADDALAHGVADLEKAAALAVHYADVFARLRALYVEQGENGKLAALLEQRLTVEERPDQRIELEVSLGRALSATGDRQAAKRALAAALDASPDHVDALRAFADLCLAEADYESAEQSFIRLARLVVDQSVQADLYLQLGDIYQTHLPNPDRAEVSYLEVLKRSPESVPARERLVALYAAQGQKDKALETQNQLLAAAAASPADKRQRTIEMAGLHERLGGDVKKAEQTLEALRKEFPHEPQVLRALAEFHQRHNHGPAVNVLLDRAAADARRALSTGRFEIHFFGNLATVFELRGNHEAALTANGTLAALEGRRCEVPGIGARAFRSDIDDAIAPDIFTPAFRTLLGRTGTVLESASIVDLKALKGSPLPPTAAPIARKIEEIAAGFGFHDVQLHVSPSIGPVCMPLSANPPALVLGQALLTEQADSIRSFLVIRAFKALQENVAIFSRTAPIDLWPLTAAFLQLFAPTWAPQGVDANKLKDFKARLQRGGPAPSGADLTALATEVATGIGNRASTLQSAANSWGSRCALLSTGDATTALDAIAWATGQPSGAPATNPDRMKWIGRNAEARDLIVFSVSDAYSEARAK